MLLRGVFDTLDEATYIDGADAYLQLLQVRLAAACHEWVDNAGGRLLLYFFLPKHHVTRGSRQLISIIT
jgi:hypothetical protein